MVCAARLVHQESFVSKQVHQLKVAIRREGRAHLRLRRDGSDLCLFARVPFRITSNCQQLRWFRDTHGVPRGPRALASEAARAVPHDG